MLRLIIGPARSGKTALQRAELTAMAKGTGHAILIVPEQASFQNEKRLWQMLGQKSQVVQVLSFSRLAQLTLQQFGGSGKLILNETASRVLMSVALEEIAGELTVYANHYHSRGFIEHIVALAEECRNSAVTPQKLSGFSFLQPEGALREKTFELSLILDAYDAVISREFISEGDNLRLAAEKLLGNPQYLADYEIYIDDFGGFTAPELGFIGALILRCKRVSVSICSDEPHSKSPAFQKAGDTVTKLLKAAQGSDAEVSLLTLPDVAPDYLPPELAGLERSVRQEALPIPTIKGEHIITLAAASPYDELCEAAAKIACLVRENGLRYGEIAIVTRDLKRYGTLLNSVLLRYEIPYFLDSPSDPKSGVLCAGLLLAVNLAAGEDADLFELAKSPLMGIDIQDAGELENYCYIWSVTASAQLKPFSNHPDGIAETMTDRDKAHLEKLEATRKRVAEPVLKLRKAMSGERGEGFAKGVYEFLKECKATENLKAFGGQLPEIEAAEFFSQQSLLWDQLMELLDIFAAMPAEIKLPSKRAAELFLLGTGCMKVATLPRTLDEVAVGTADRMRAADPKAMFIIGAVQGEFPAVTQQNPLLSDSERKRLTESGLELKDGVGADAHEKMLCYRAVTAPSQWLWTSFPAAEQTGEVLSPSMLYTLALEHSQVLETRSAPLQRVQTLSSAEAELAAGMGRNDGGQAALWELCRNKLPPKRLELLQNARRRHVRFLEEKGVASALFGRSMKLSPSRMERYYNCPFSYFLQSGLKLRPRRKAELSSIEAGTLIHFVLEKMVSLYTPQQLWELEYGALSNQVQALVERYVLERVGTGEQLSPRLRKNFLRIGDQMCELIKRLAIELCQSSFRPEAFELKIEKDGTVEPLTLTTADGITVTVEGTIDRLDTATVNGKRYLRVVDYKSGGKSFLLSDVFYGLNMQMLIYMFSVCQNGKDTLANLLPAGVLYQPALGKYHNLPRGEEGDKLQKEIARHYRMSGLILNDDAVLKAMEFDGNGLFIPVKAGQNSSQALATLAELGHLKILVERRVTDMADSLCGGRIEVLPAGKGNEKPCTYCDYKGVCGFEEGDPIRKIESLAREDILKEVQSDGLD